MQLKHYLLVLMLLWAGIASAQLRILTLGDSNGAYKNGWVAQLKTLRPADSIINTSVSGNTIGFDNLNKTELNTLKNLPGYLQRAKTGFAGAGVDEVVILLGTNDCKNTFKDRREESIDNLTSIIQTIKLELPAAGITLITPPPFGPDSTLEEKYLGGNACVRELVWQYHRLALSQNIDFIDMYVHMQAGFEKYTTDGVHFNTAGYVRMAELINKHLKTKYTGWDVVKKEIWPEEFVKVDISSSSDRKTQHAYFRQTKADTKQPLIVSLHTWSADYTQADPLSSDAARLNYNYIRPDFRGPNHSPESMGSALAIADIDDAIAYAIAQGRVDKHKIYVVGTSGGGHAALCAYQKSKYALAGVYAWVGISDIYKWYAESRGRENKYAEHILAATSSTAAAPDTLAMWQRSPLHMDVAVKPRKSCRLYLYAGIHDGYTGSVPITHSIEMYNKVSKAYRHDTVSAQITQALLARRKLPLFEPEKQIGKRAVWYEHKNPQTLLILFEGGHEMITEYMVEEMMGWY